MPNQNSLETLFEEYLLECSYTKHLRPDTIIGYKAVFTTFKKIMPEITSASDLHPRIFHIFFKRLGTRERIVGKSSRVTGVKPSTVKTYFNKLMVFFKWLESNAHISKDCISENVTKPPEPTYEDERALTEKEVSKIISSITLHTADDLFRQKRDLLIFSIFLFTGVRRRELLSLRIQDVDLVKKSLFINGATSKGKKNRYVPLHPQLWMQLKVYLNMRKQQRSTCDALIISIKRDTKLTEHGLKHWVSRYKRLSGVRFHIHQTRHTFACSLARIGADITSIMKTLGHSNMVTTQRYLRSITPEESRNYIEQIVF